MFSLFYLYTDSLLVIWALETEQLMGKHDQTVVLATLALKYGFKYDFCLITH